MFSGGEDRQFLFQLLPAQRQKTLAHSAAHEAATAAVGAERTVLQIFRGDTLCDQRLALCLQREICLPHRSQGFLSAYTL